MKYLADTHILVWAATSSPKLTKKARNVLDDLDHELWFSAASLWEASIRFTLGKGDFTLPPATLRRGLLNNGYKELSVTCEHAIAVANLPDHHGDPFDRLLVAQALMEGMTLLTSDKDLAHYPGTLRV